MKPSPNAVGSGEVWAIRTDSTVREFNAAGQTWTEPSPGARLIQLSVGTYQQVYGINSEGSVYLYNTKTKLFDLVDDSDVFMEMSVGGSTAGLWGITNDGAIYQF